MKTFKRFFRRVSAVLLLAGFVVLLLGSVNPLAAADPAPLRPAHFVGTWSNKKGEFQTLNIGLRSDGRGVFATAVFPMLTRWQATPQGLHLRTTLPSEGGLGRVVEYDLEYNQKHDVLLFRTKDGVQTLVKVDSDEPKDLEAQVEASLVAESKRFKRSEPGNLVPVTGRDELLAYLPILVDIKHVIPKELDISAPKQGWKIHVVNRESRTTKTPEAYVAVSLLDQGVAKPGAVLKTTRYRNETLPELPLNYKMADADRKALEGWLDQQGLKHSLYDTLGKSIWSIDKRDQRLLIGPIAGVGATVRVLEHLLRESFHAESGGYRVLTNDEVGAG